MPAVQFAVNFKQFLFDFENPSFYFPQFPVQAFAAAMVMTVMTVVAVPFVAVLVFAPVISTVMIPISVAITNTETGTDMTVIIRHPNPGTNM